MSDKNCAPLCESLLAIMSSTTIYLLRAISPLALRTVCYKLVFRFRGIRASLLACIVISGAGFLVFIPLPELVAKIAVIGVAIWFCQYITDVEPYPDGILLPIGIELFSMAIFMYVVPLIVG